MKSLGVDFFSTRDVRWARWDDIERISEIELLSQPVHPWPRKWFESELIRNETRFLVSEAHTILGYCVWWQTSSAAEILNIATDPAYRNCGIARELLQKTVALVRKAGAPTLDLELRVDNIPALSLYRSCGFLPVGQRRGYYRDGCDALLMRRTIS